MKQNFEYICLWFTKKQFTPIQDNDLRELKQALVKSFGKNLTKFEPISDEEDGLYGVEVDIEGLEFELEVEPYSPPTWDDPGSGGIYGGYDDEQELMKDMFKCPNQWEYEIEDSNYDSYDSILNDDNDDYDEPDYDDYRW